MEPDDFLLRFDLNVSSLSSRRSFVLRCVKLTICSFVNSGLMTRDLFRRFGLTFLFRRFGFAFLFPRFGFVFLFSASQRSGGRYLQDPVL